MKYLIPLIVAIAMLTTLARAEGDRMSRNLDADAKHKALVALKADPDYLSDAAYSNLLANANNVSQLKDAMLKKQKSDAKAKQLIKEKIKEVNEKADKVKVQKAK